MLPQALKSSDYGTPVAALTIDGLGLCRFDSSLVWEVAFLRRDHQLALKVKRVDQKGKIVKDFPIIPIDDFRRITFSVGNGAAFHFTDFPQGAFTLPSGFSRFGDDSYDFRWVIDFIGREVGNGDFRAFRKGESITVLSIPNALFYTHAVTADSVIIAPRDTPTPEAFPAFGRTNELVGAAIYAKPAGTIRLDYAEPNGTPIKPLIELDPVLDQLYEMSFTNLDSEKLADKRALVGDYVPGDFAQYYRCLDVTGSKQYQLFAPPRTSARARDGDCHLMGAGHFGGTLPSLKDLVKP